MDSSALATIDEVAESGRAVISGSDSNVVEVVKAAILSDVSASFYLTNAQTRAIKDWYWTPERLELTGLRKISVDEDSKIRSELGLDLKNFRFSPFACECGQVYGAFEFLQQGVQQHGLLAIEATFSLKHATLFQVNPTFVPICTACSGAFENSMMARGGGWYDCDGYGGCCCCAAIVFSEA